MHLEVSFYEWLTLHSLPLWGYDEIVNLFATCPVESLTYLWSFNSVSWKLCEWTWNLRFFEWLALHSWTPWGTVESSTPPRLAPESLWPVWEVWTLYLENRANALRQTYRDRDRQRQRQTDNPLYRYRFNTYLSSLNICCSKIFCDSLVMFL